MARASPSSGRPHRAAVCTSWPPTGQACAGSRMGRPRPGRRTGRGWLTVTSMISTDPRSGSWLRMELARTQSRRCPASSKERASPRSPMIPRGVRVEREGQRRALGPGRCPRGLSAPWSAVLRQVPVRAPDERRRSEARVVERVREVAGLLSSHQFVNSSPLEGELWVAFPADVVRRYVRPGLVSTRARLSRLQNRPNPKADGRYLGGWTRRITFVVGSIDHARVRPSPSDRHETVSRAGMHQKCGPEAGDSASRRSQVCTARPVERAIFRTLPDPWSVIRCTRLGLVPSLDRRRYESSRCEPSRDRDAPATRGWGRGARSSHAQRASVRGHRRAHPEPKTVRTKPFTL
jgi:hypothetical protein